MGATRNTINKVMLMAIFDLAPLTADAADYCSNWARAEGVEMKRFAVLMNLKKINKDNRYDGQCIERRLDEFVRLTNRICASGRSIPPKQYIWRLMDKAEELCP